MTKLVAPRRTLFHGPFNAGQSKRAREAACAASDTGVRDILYVVANGTARLAVRSELVRRRSAVFGLRVVTLRGLPREIERRARVKGPAIAGGIVDELLVEQALHTAGYKTNSSVVTTGLAAAAARTIAGVERAGGTVSSFENAMESIRPSGDGPAILRETWRELDRLRGPGTRSSADLQRAAIGLLRTRGDVLFGVSSFIVLEDLPLFGAPDCELMATLVSVARCPIIATSEYAQQLPSAPATKAYNLLRSVANWDEQSCTRDHDPLARAADRIFGAIGNQSEIRKPDVAIVRLEAAGEVGEVRLAARVILRHLRNSTADRPICASDILVVARGSHYRALIRDIFTGVGIGVNSGAVRSVADTALGSVLLGLVRLALDPNGGTRDQALALLRSPHLDVGQRAADRIARRVITLGYGSLDSWDERALRLSSTRATNRVERLKRAIATARATLTAATSNQDMTRAVRRLAKELRLVGNAYFARNRLFGLGAGDVLERQLADAAVREDNQAWEVVERTLDVTMPDLLRAGASGTASSRSPFAEKWLSLFTRALDAETQGRNATGSDIVRVAGASAGDGQPSKVTIILGLRQQVFPRQPRQNPFLRDSVRERLKEFGIDVATSEDTTDGERESFIRAITTATDSLYLSYAATDAVGKPAVASFFIEDLQRAIGSEHVVGVEKLGIADVVPRPEDAATRSEFLAAVAHGIWQRLPATSAAEVDRSASFAAWNELFRDSVSLTAVSDGRRAPVRPSFSQNALQLAPHNTLELSASQLNTVEHCTYQHFVDKVLHPARLDEPEYNALMKGTLVHDAMMEWAKLDGWHRGTAALAELDRWFERRAATMVPSILGRPAELFAIAEDREKLNGFVREELRAIQSSGAAQPTFNELAFGPRMAMRANRDRASVLSTFDLSVATSIGTRMVRFTGSIDRVDTYHVGERTYGIALDYKTGATSKRYSDCMLNGTDLQLRLYLLALERLWNIQPMGALYAGFGDHISRGAISEEAADHIGEFDPKCVTVMAADAWDKFVHAETEQLIQPLVERLVTFDIIARPARGDCGFCELISVCRYNSYDAAFSNA